MYIFFWVISIWSILRITHCPFIALTFAVFVLSFSLSMRSLCFASTYHLRNALIVKGPTKSDPYSMIKPSSIFDKLDETIIISYLHEP